MRETFDGKIFEVITESVSDPRAIGGPDLGVFFTVLVDGKLFYKFDPDLGEAKNAADALRQSIEEAKRQKRIADAKRAAEEGGAQ